MDLSFLPDTVRTQVAALGNDISTSFFAELKQLTPNDQEKAIIANAAQVLAAASILTIGADDATKSQWKQRSNFAIAELANLGVAAAIEAADAIRRVASQAVTKAVEIATSALFAAI